MADATSGEAETIVEIDSRVRIALEVRCLRHTHLGTAGRRVELPLCPAVRLGSDHGVPVGGCFGQGEVPYNVPR